MVNAIGGWRTELERLWGGGASFWQRRAMPKWIRSFPRPSPLDAGSGIYPDLIQENLFNYSSVAIRADSRLGFQSLGEFAKGEPD